MERTVRRDPPGHELCVLPQVSVFCRPRLSALLTQETASGPGPYRCLSDLYPFIRDLAI
jgi:hypothetical protein